MLGLKTSQIFLPFLKIHQEIFYVFLRWQGTLDFKIYSQRLPFQLYNIPSIQYQSLNPQVSGGCLNSSCLSRDETPTTKKQFYFGREEFSEVFIKKYFIEMVMLALNQ